MKRLSLDIGIYQILLFDKLDPGINFSISSTHSSVLIVLMDNAQQRNQYLCSPLQNTYIDNVRHIW